MNIIGKVETAAGTLANCWNSTALRGRSPIGKSTAVDWGE